MADAKKYAPKDYSKVRGLAGISDKQIEEHLKLYEGYVKRCNTLTEKLFAICGEGKASGADPVYAELTRRLGFEYGGMVNHEYYFENLTAGAQAEPAAGSKFKKAVEASFGSYANWLADFRAVATMPGIGWAFTFQDPKTGWLSNHFVQLHQDNLVAGFKPVLVMDGWEHAFMRDYLATERAKYVDAFFKNVDWAAVEGRVA
ncbi:MAG: Fe-Mn family superoxide dismutase [Anaeromyxobacter sp.]